MADRTMEQAVGRKLCEEALRKIDEGKSTFEDELKRLQAAKNENSDLRRDWALAERLLKKARAEQKDAIAEPPEDESAAL